MKRRFRDHSLIRRLYRPRYRPPASDRELRRAEVELLHRQVRVSYANVLATVALSVALLTLTFCQWRTAESTAAIERAKARPHFRIRQENQHDELGFLPRRFEVQPDAGVADATEATAISIMSIHYQSRDLRIWGICRAAFVNFYAWTNDSMSFELADGADRIMTLSRTPDQTSEAFIRIQPLWVLVDVSFTDVFGAPGRQSLHLMAGRPAQMTASERRNASTTGMELNLHVDNRGRVGIYRVNTNPVSPDCVNALRVMNRIDGLKIGRDYIIPSDRSYLIVRDPNGEPQRNRPITANEPAPRIMNVQR